MNRWQRVQRWRHRDDEINEEIRAHLNLAAQDRIANGESALSVGAHHGTGSGRIRRGQANSSV